MALHHIGLCVLFGISCNLAKPLITYSPLEGSTEEEELNNCTSSVSTNNFFSEYQTTPVGPTHVETDFLSQAMKFLEDNMLLIRVTSIFIFLVIFIISGAVFMSHRRKVSAYYPSSFPSKMYVDQRDKTGGANLFKEVPENPATEQETETVDFHKQLQEDIMRAAKSLRTPNKFVDAADGSDQSEKATHHSPKDSSEPESSILDKQLSSHPEKEQCDLSDSKRAAVNSCPQSCPSDKPRLEDSEPLNPEKDASQESLIGRGPRPSSLHIHNDAATLHLIAGEKTAF